MRVLCGGHWQAPVASRRYACGQAENMWLRRATEGYGCGGTGERRPLCATDKEEGKREGRPCINNSKILTHDPMSHVNTGTSDLDRRSALVFFYCLGPL